MSTFIQLHLLTSYPPANLNRDDLGRPKTAVMGGVQRLRISSQSLKRAWRSSSLFEEALSGHLGTRTKRLGAYVYRALVSGRPLQELIAEPLEDSPMDRAAEKEMAWRIASVFVDKLGRADDDDPGDEADEEQPAGKKGKKKGAKNKQKSNVDRESLQCEQLVFYSTMEIASIDRTVQEYRSSGKPPGDKALRRLAGRENHDADIAMFGRMLAASPDKNVEAAVQVAHAISVHQVAVEDDYFSAVDDLNFGVEDVGAGHIGETEFAAGLFYLYVCVDRDLLKQNLQGNEDLTTKALQALVEATATVAPTGKQNSFASRAYASWVLAEKGSKQPRSLSVAFLKPVAGSDMLGSAIGEVKAVRDKMDTVYGPLATARYEMDAQAGVGEFKGLLDFVSRP